MGQHTPGRENQLNIRSQSGFSLMDVIIGSAMAAIVVSIGMLTTTRFTAMSAKEEVMTTTKTNYLRAKAILQEIHSVQRVHIPNESTTNHTLGHGDNDSFDVRTVTVRYLRRARNFGSYEDGNHKHVHRLFLSNYSSRNGEYDDELGRYVYEVENAQNKPQINIRVGTIINECVPHNQDSFPDYWPMIVKLKKQLENHPNGGYIDFRCGIGWIPHDLKTSNATYIPWSCPQDHTLRATVEYKPLNRLVSRSYYPAEKVNRKIIAGAICHLSSKEIYLMTAVRLFKSKDINKDYKWIIQDLEMPDPNYSNVSYSVEWDGTEATLTSASQEWPYDY